MLSNLILGLIAWILPIINLVYRKKISSFRKTYFPIMSFTLASIAILSQFVYENKLVILDNSAYLDTIEASIMAAVVLLVVTILLNLLSVYITNRE